jgi:hypothetical protein
MTIFAATTSVSGGIVWTDSESYVGGDVYSRAVTKLHLAPLANCIGFGNGALELCRAGGLMMMECIGFDEMVGRLPAFLAHKAAEREKLFDDFEVEFRDMDFPHAAKFCVMGWSERFRQWLLASFCSQAGFVVRFHRQFSAPFIHHDISDDRHSIEGDAVWQMREIQQKIPNATGGALIVARVSSQGLSCSRMLKFELAASSACEAADGAGGVFLHPAGEF